VGGMQSVIDMWKTGEESTTLIILVLIFARRVAMSFGIYHGSRLPYTRGAITAGL
jgi:hypothetical protein